MEIKKTAIVGMGALGMMYGEHIQSALGRESVSFVMDTERYRRHMKDVYTVNGVHQDFVITDCSKAETADLVIVATKYNGLHSALDVMEKVVGDNTIIISVMNGISSEEIIAQRYGDKNLVYCVAIGMDAMREGTTLNYQNKGKLQVGIVKPEQQEALVALTRFFDRVHMPYVVEPDILHALWGKFLLNVGINQTCMVYDATYYEALNTKEYFENMWTAMHEVIAIAQAEGVQLTEEDYERDIAIIRTLKDDGYPSMRQDALAKRKSEVELFAGTVIKIAGKHGIAVPINQFYYDKVAEMEKGYS